MDKNLDKLLTASKLKNWLACNYTTINEINKKGLKKKEVMNLKKKFTKN